MVISLEAVTFENDIFTFVLPDNNTLTLNKIDEVFETQKQARSADTETTVFDRINVQVTRQNEDGTTELLETACTVGNSCDLYRISTDYKEYNGQVLNSQNMPYCKMEYYD